MACPTCKVETEYSSAGHPTLCLDCTMRELDATLMHPRSAHKVPTYHHRTARGLRDAERARAYRKPGLD